MSEEYAKSKEYTKEMLEIIRNPQNANPNLWKNRSAVEKTLENPHVQKFLVKNRPYICE